MKRFRALCAQKIPCVVISRGFHLDPALLEVAAEEKIAVFRTPMITMKFINAATIALEMDFSPTATEFGSMVDILGIGVLIRGASGIGKSETRAWFDRAWLQSCVRRCDANDVDRGS